MTLALSIDIEPPTLRRMPVPPPEESVVRMRHAPLAPETMRSPAPAPSVSIWRDAHKRLERRAATLMREGGREAQVGADVVTALHALQELWAAVLWEGRGSIDGDAPLAALVDEMHAWASLVVQEFEEVCARNAADEDTWDVGGRSFAEESMLRVLAGVEPARDALEREVPGLPESAALRDAIGALHRNLRASP